MEFSILYRYSAEMLDKLRFYHDDQRKRVKEETYTRNSCKVSYKSHFITLKKTIHWIIKANSFQSPSLEAGAFALVFIGQP